MGLFYHLDEGGLLEHVRGYVMSHDTLDLGLHGRIKCRVEGGTGVNGVRWENLWG